MLNEYAETIFRDELICKAIELDASMQKIWKY